MKESEQLFVLFKQTHALLEGHFQLTSGLHSPHYVQCAKVLQYPRHAETLCAVIAEQFTPLRIDAVIAPALGGIVVGQEVGRQLGVRSMFAERKAGTMQLRRGFEIAVGERILVCEDVITTGGSVDEVIALVKAFGGMVAGVGCIVDRSGGRARFELPPAGKYVAALRMDVVTYQPDDCPLCKAGLPVTKPGSRGSL